MLERNRMGTDPLCGRDKSDEDCLRPIFSCQGLVLGSVPVVAIRRHVPVHEPFPIALEGGARVPGTCGRVRVVGVRQAKLGMDY